MPASAFAFFRKAQLYRVTSVAVLDRGYPFKVASNVEVIGMNEETKSSFFSAEAEEVVMTPYLRESKQRFPNLSHGRLDLSLRSLGR